MSITVLTKTYFDLPFNKKEILRYADCKEITPEIEKLLNECIEEATQSLSYKACYCVLPVKITGKTIDFGAFNVNSEKLKTNLKTVKK